MWSRYIDLRATCFHQSVDTKIPFYLTSLNQGPDELNCVDAYHLSHSWTLDVVYPILPVLRVINQPSEIGSTIAREVGQRRAVPADIYLVEESPIPGSGRSGCWAIMIVMKMWRHVDVGLN